MKLFISVGDPVKKVLHFAGVESFIFWNAVFVIRGSYFSGCLHKKKN